MKVTITVGEAIQLGIWEELCDIKNINEWAVSAGLMSEDDIIELTLDEAFTLGLYRRR